MELEADFANPSAGVDYEARLKRQGVILHSVRSYYTSIYGLVTVQNLSYHKKVIVRYTTNDWKTHCETKATYVSRAKPDVPSDSDQFRFTIFASPKDFYGPEAKLAFAVCYITEDGQERWDNNEGLNYIMKGHSKAIPSNCNSNRNWVHFM